MRETWNPIPGYEGFYEASNLGRIKSLSRQTLTKAGATRFWPGRILKPRVDDDPRYRRNGRKIGYLSVFLSREGKIVRRTVHRLVLEAFVGPRPNGKQTRHLDGDPANNRLINLRWGTPKEDAADKFRHGTMAAGPNHPNQYS